MADTGDNTDDSTTWLSQAAFDRLSAELEHLRTEGRAEVSHEIEVARGHGDLSENAEYDAAKEKQGHMEARIRQLEALLREASIGEPENTGVVAAGLVVTLAINGDEETYLVGSREDSHPDYDILSAQSPIGEAVIGHEVDDTVTVRAPAGSFEATIIGIQSP